MHDLAMNLQIAGSFIKIKKTIFIRQQVKISYKL